MILFFFSVLLSDVKFTSSAFLNALDLSNFIDINNYRTTINKLLGERRIDKLDKIKNGKTQLIIGTHALIQEGVNFKKFHLVSAASNT